MGLLRHEQELAPPARTGQADSESTAPAELADLTMRGNQTVARMAQSPTATPFRAVTPPGATLARTPAPAGPTLARKPAPKPASGVGGHDISSKGVDLIAEFEGFRDKAYQDAVGVWTIGYGHTGGVRPGQRITREEGKRLLAQDCARFVRAVNTKIKVALNQNQFDALVSLSFNLGENGWKGLLATLNRGDYQGAQRMFGQYVHAGGRVLRGLVRRRAKEAELFGSNAPAGDTRSPGEGKGKPGGPSPGGGGVYTVVKGDTLWGISRRHGMTLSQLLAINPQFRKNPDLIFPGQKVNLAKGAKTPGKGKDDKKPRPPGQGGSVVSIASSYLGRHANELKRSGDLPMDPSIPPDICCANFVTAVLEKAGLLSHSEHTNSVSALKGLLERKGWRAFKDKSRARPGDVWTEKVSGSHTEIVYSNSGGGLELIGSNNTGDAKPPGGQKISIGRSYGSPVFYSPPD